MNLRYQTIISLLTLVTLNACATPSASSSDSSKPINDAESQQYKKALLRCYKTGGSRIVKINGVLRCF
ncbi:MAG: hypothetical protein HRU09_18810 [Oligoflexales bacterium]|nr:hypothetical protein [Oligoflexales bacterium]